MPYEIFKLHQYISNRFMKNIENHVKSSSVSEIKFLTKNMVSLFQQISGKNFESK